jgi:putative hydrolase of the HAD superfamily
MTGSTQLRTSRIQGIILDYGEVLCFKPTDEQIRRMADVFDISPARFRELYEKNRRAYDRGDLTPERYWFSFADELGVALAAHEIQTLRDWDAEMWSSTNAEMIEWLRTVHLEGVRTALLSNMHADMVAKVRHDFDWTSNFDCMIFSYEVRAAKPEARIYELCLKGLGTAAHNTVFVDDREINVKAAQELGIPAIRFESIAQLRDELEKFEFPILPMASASPQACAR